MNKSGVSDENHTYMTKIDIGKPFTITVNKGYGINKPAWKLGKQFVLQPSIAQSDLTFKFNAHESIHGAPIASDRSANEQAVHLAQVWEYVSKGLLAHECSNRLDNIWLVWGYQVTFMYKPMLYILCMTMRSD
jgi:hypothetical protein